MGCYPIRRWLSLAPAGCQARFEDIGGRCLGALSHALRDPVNQHTEANPWSLLAWDDGRLADPHLPPDHPLGQHRDRHSHRVSFMQLPHGFSAGVMQFDEVRMLDQWTADEGWNPGLHDLALAHSLDAEAFIALRQTNVLAGAGTIFRHAPGFGFMGLFIMRKDLRGQGIGRSLWHRRRDALLARLTPHAVIGMDGVFDMVPFYTRGGFRFAHRSLRYQGLSSGGARDSAVVEVDALPAEQLAAFDARHFPCARPTFLSAWVRQPQICALALVEDGEIRAFGARRVCRTGFKIGPLFADSTAFAERLLGALLEGTSGAQMQIDIPEPNAAGLALARTLGMTECFGCARLYLGQDPALPLQRIFGVTSFEFG